MSLSRGGEFNMMTTQTSPDCGCYIGNEQSELELFTEAIHNPAIRKQIIAILEEAGLLPS